MAEWKWPRGNWWKPKPNWWTRSAHYHALPETARTILTGAWDLAEGELIVPSDPEMLGRASGIDARPVRVAQYVAAIIERGFAVDVGDGSMRLVHEYSEHCRLAPSRTGSVPRAYRKRTESVQPEVPLYDHGTAQPPTSAELPAPNKNSFNKNASPLSEENPPNAFALAPPPVEPAKPKKAKKEPPPPPEPVVVPEHMRPLAEYQERARLRAAGKAKQTVDDVIRWALTKEEYLGFRVDWRRLVHRFEEWQHEKQTYRPSTTGALTTWIGNSETRGSIREWEVGAAPSQPVNGNGRHDRKNYNQNGGPQRNPDGSFNPNWNYNPVPDPNWTAKSYLDGLTPEEIAQREREMEEWDNMGSKGATA